MNTTSKMTPEQAVHKIAAFVGAILARQADVFVRDALAAGHEPEEVAAALRVYAEQFDHRPIVHNIMRAVEELERDGFLDEGE